MARRPAMAHRIFFFSLVSLKNQRRQTGSIQGKTGMAHRGEDKMALRMAIDNSTSAVFGEDGHILAVVGRVCSSLVRSIIKVLGNKYDQTERDRWPTSESRTN
jgi:hypothetical protein